MHFHSLGFFINSDPIAAILVLLRITRTGIYQDNLLDLSWLEWSHWQLQKVFYSPSETRSSLNFFDELVELNCLPCEMSIIYILCSQKRFNNKFVNKSLITWQFFPFSIMLSESKRILIAFPMCFRMLNQVEMRRVGYTNSIARRLA